MKSSPAYWNKLEAPWQCFSWHVCQYARPRGATTPFPHPCETLPRHSPRSLLPPLELHRTLCSNNVLLETQTSLQVCSMNFHMSLMTRNQIRQLSMISISSPDLDHRVLWSVGPSDTMTWVHKSSLSNLNKSVNSKWCQILLGWWLQQCKIAHYTQSTAQPNTEGGSVDSLDILIAKLQLYHCHSRYLDTEAGQHTDKPFYLNFK